MRERRSRAGPTGDTQPGARPGAAVLLEGDRRLRAQLRAGVVRAGLAALEAPASDATPSWILRSGAALAVVGSTLPEPEAVRLVEAVRRRSTGVGSAPALIVVSASGTESHAVAALDAGADDVVGLPLRLDEFAARIRAALRGPAGRGPETFVFRDLKLDFARREATRGRRRVPLTPNEFKLLAALARHAGCVVPHRQLLREVWGPEYMDSPHYLRVYVGYLRKKLERDPRRPKLLLNEPGVGYRFAVE